MAELLSPGVYVKEVPAVSQPIAGVSTSVAVFIGTFQFNMKVKNKKIGTGDGKTTDFTFEDYPVDPGSVKVHVDNNVDATSIASNDDQQKKSKVTITPAPANNADIHADYTITRPIDTFELKLCSNFTQLKSFFGDLSSDPQKNYLFHAVYGFFNNGGSRCYVVRFNQNSDLLDALQALKRIDDISLIAYPGNLDKNIQGQLIDHCSQMGDRFAILDGPSTEGDLTKLTSTVNGGLMPQKTDMAAWYFPWITIKDPNTNNLLNVPPSGHVAGIYARVDNDRGVHKAPANEAIRGVLDVSQPLSKEEQSKLNPKGVNCIRKLNNNILIWGARTVGGDDNEALKYINVRRTLLFLRKSIDQGTQWAVFEPNTPALWQKIKRNVSDFLTVQWRAGALFGNTVQEAFYVKCDAETNPPEERNLGRVNAVIGVAIVKPAEFIIFTISQTTIPS